MTHLRYAHLPEEELEPVFLDLIRQTPFLMDALQIGRTMNLPDWWGVSGALYNTIWNHLTNRPLTHGIKDIDLFYFDPDTSYAAEDRQIKRAEKLFPSTPPIELRNQARVHLWYADHFGFEIPPYRDSRHGIDHFACKTHCVGVRMEGDDRLTLYAPYGLSGIFNFRVIPNTLRPNRETHERKGTRALECWPELTIDPWPGNT